MNCEKVCGNCVHYEPTMWIAGYVWLVEERRAVYVRAVLGKRKCTAPNIANLYRDCETCEAPEGSFVPLGEVDSSITKPDCTKQQLSTRPQIPASTNK